MEEDKEYMIYIQPIHLLKSAMWRPLGYVQLQGFDNVLASIPKRFLMM
jgi:hypothetical protein